MSATQNKDTARKFVQEIFNEGKIDEAKNFVTSGIVYHGLEEVKGLEEFKKWVRGDRESFPDLKVTILDDFAEQDKVALRWNLKATFKKEFQGIQPTNNEITTNGVEILHFENGKIKEAWTVFDTFTPP
jgi:predicted ester cyclase